jgi:hypothetical protein
LTLCKGVSWEAPLFYSHFLNIDTDKEREMKKILLNTIALMIMSISTYAEEIHSHVEGNNTVISVKSVRGIMGENDPIVHTRAQVRAGYITFLEEGTSRTSAYALGGHYHFDTKRWNGLALGLSAYAVLNLGMNQNDLQLNPDFFDNKGDSFAQLTEVYLDGKWGNTELKLGRQILDTPHADSDDIRMIPNYFEAYTLRNSDVQDLRLSVGFIRKMAGWENGVDASSFVNIGQTLGTDNIEGVYYASASYDAIKDLSLSLWYYHYTDIAMVFYSEIGYEYHASKALDVIFGLQYDISQETGSAFLGQQDAHTFGASVEFVSEMIGVHLLMAYNKDSGDTGASSLNLGGGALFTSMEDQTLDAMGQAGEAWMIGLGYHFDAIGVEGLNAGVAYGCFTANKASSYKANELDVVIEYTFNERFSLVTAYASTQFENQGVSDYSQLRVVTNYNF